MVSIVAFVSLYNSKKNFIAVSNNQRPKTTIAARHSFNAFSPHVGLNIQIVFVQSSCLLKHSS